MSARRTTRTLAGIGLPVLLAPLLAGCAAFRNDLDGIPARYVPEEYRVASERGKEPIDPSLLGQTPPAEYRVDSGDVLSVYVEGVLGRPPEVPPVQSGDDRLHRPATGYPITVRADGTLGLPYEGAVNVRGLSLRQVERRLRDYYTHTRPLLREGRSRVLVSVHRPRTHRVLVVRQESGNRQGNIGSGGAVNFEIDKRGTGRVVELPAGRNDVLNALAETGGLPGIDARNAVFVIRRPRTTVVPPPEHACPTLDAPQPTVIWSPLADARRNRRATTPRTIVRAQSPINGSRQWMFATGPGVASRGVVHAAYASATPAHRRVVPIADFSPVVEPSWEPLPAAALDPPLTDVAEACGASPWNVPYTLDDATIRSERVTRIPLRMYPGEPVAFGPEDVILEDGDVVFVESRQTEFFYTGGLLGGGQYELPRDFDLNVIEAIALVERIGTGRNRLARQVSGPAATGLDVSSSASELIVLRTLPDGRQVSIKVDLYKAMIDPAERILVAPGDYLFLKYTRCEAVGAWIERWLFDNVANGVNSSPWVTGGNN